MKSTAVLDGDDLLGVFIGDFELALALAELFLEGHDQLDEVQRVGVQVFHERCVGNDLVFFNAKLLDSDFGNALENGRQRSLRQV